MGIRSTKLKTTRRTRIRKGIRRKLEGTSARPRLSVFRSNKEIYAQLIDDRQAHTIISASSRDKDIDGKTKTKSEISKQVGLKLAKNAVEAGIQSVVFDRGGYLYHGRVKSLAEGAREAGLKF